MKKKKKKRKIHFLEKKEIVSKNETDEMKTLQDKSGKN